MTARARHRAGKHSISVWDLQARLGHERATAYTAEIGRMLARRACVYGGQYAAAIAKGAVEGYLPQSGRVGGRR